MDFHCHRMEGMYRCSRQRDCCGCCRCSCCFCLGFLSNSTLQKEFRFCIIRNAEISELIYTRSIAHKNRKKLVTIIVIMKKHSQTTAMALAATKNNCVYAPWSVYYCGIKFILMRSHSRHVIQFAHRYAICTVHTYGWVSSARNVPLCI